MLRHAARKHSSLPHQLLQQSQLTDAFRQSSILSSCSILIPISAAVAATAASTQCADVSSSGSGARRCAATAATQATAVERAAEAAATDAVAAVPARHYLPSAAATVLLPPHTQLLTLHISSSSGSSSRVGAGAAATHVLVGFYRTTLCFCVRGPHPAHLPPPPNPACVVLAVPQPQ